MNNTYYENEVREGFFIPGMIKRSWAVQMDVLDHIRLICDKYDIKWFADCGTLLGAVRHHGFIPWDDDLDICMLKADYDRFLSVVDDELPQDYRLLNIYKEQEYTDFITRIVNHGEIDISEEFMRKNHGFPYIAGIDIFPIHNLFNDEEKENDRYIRGKRLWDLTLKFNNGEIKDNEIRGLIEEVEKYSKKRFRRDVPIKNALYLAIESVFSEADEEAAEYVSLMPVYMQYPRHRYTKHIFDQSIDMCFEDIVVQVPAEYEKLLDLEYRNWETANLKGGLHDYPCFFEQEKELEKHLGGKLPYKYYGPFLKEKNCTTEESGEQIFSMLDQAHVAIYKAFELGLRAQALEMLEKCQKLAINLGTETENTYAEEANETVAILEEYCEDLYQFSMNVESCDHHENINTLNRAIEKARNAYENLKSKLVIFIVYRKEEWNKLEALYRKFHDKDGKEAFVMPIPYYEKDWFGRLTNEHLDDSWLPPDVKALDYREYDYSKKEASFVYTNPFDSYDSAISVHPFFYSTNLKKYSNRLIYVHTYETKVFGESEKARENAKSYVLSPGVLNADFVIVPNANERELYIDILSGNDRSIGKEELLNKIVCENMKDEKKKSVHNKKIILFYTGFSSIYTNETKALDKINRVITCFSENKNVYVRWIADGKLENNLKILGDDIVLKYNELKNRFCAIGIGEYIETDDASVCDDADAYYGSGGFFMTRCVTNQIPTMKWNIEI